MTTAITKQTAPTKPFDGAAAVMLLGEDHGKLKALAIVVEHTARRIAAVEIKTDEDAIGLNDLLAAAKVAADELESDRKARKDPVIREGKEIDAIYKPASQAFTYVKDTARKKLTDHIRRKEEEAAAQAREMERLKQKAEREQHEAILKIAEAKTEAEKADADASLVTAQQTMIEAHRARPLEAVPTGVRSDMAHSSIRYKKVAVISDMAKIPRSYLEEALKLDEKPLLKIILRAAQNDVYVEGTQIVEEPVLSTRVQLQ